MKEKSAIKEMLLGNRGTFENIKSSNVHKYARDEMFKIVDSFIEKLSPELVETFDNVFIAISKQ